MGTIRPDYADCDRRIDRSTDEHHRRVLQASSPLGKVAFDWFFGWSIQYHSDRTLEIMLEHENHRLVKVGVHQ